MKDLNTEEQFIHSMNNKLFALYGKIMTVKSLASDNQIILELDKLENCYKEAQSVLQEYKFFIENKSNL